MHLTLISPPETVPQEQQIVNSMFREGLQSFHLRKPDFSDTGLKAYLEAIPSVFHNRIVIHSHYELALTYNLKGIHLSQKTKDDPNIGLTLQNFQNKSISASFHSTRELSMNCVNYNYVFLSPVFDSISKSGYKSKFKLNELKQFLELMHQRPHPPQIIALGGITPDNIDKTKELEFDGIALIGSIWHNTIPLLAFRRIQGKIASLNKPLNTSHFK